MPDRSGEGSALKRQIHIKASPETVYRLLTDPRRIPLWMGRSAVFEPRPGGDFKIEVNAKDTAAGKVVEVEPNERVVFTFGWERADNPIRPGGSTVEITLQRAGTGTLVTLLHTGLPADAIADHSLGWDHYLARLAIVAAGGDAGPDEFDSPQEM